LQNWSKVLIERQTKDIWENVIDCCYKIDDIAMCQALRTFEKTHANFGLRFISKSWNNQSSSNVDWWTCYFQILLVLEHPGW